MPASAQTSIQHDHFQLDFDPIKGTWTGLKYRDITILPPNQHSGFDLNIADRPPLTPQLVNCEQNKTSRHAQITLHYELLQAGPGTDQSIPYTATQSFKLLTNPDRIEQQLTIKRCELNGRNTQPDKLLSATLLTIGITAGESEHTRVSIPMARNIVDRPLNTLLDRPRIFDKEDTIGDHYRLKVSAPDRFIGSAFFYNNDPELHVSVIPLPYHCPVVIGIYGHNNTVALENEFECEAFIKPGDEINVAAQTFIFNQAHWTHAVPASGNYLARHAGYKPPDDRPAWAKTATIYEISLQHAGSFNNITNKLDYLKDIGFNTIYLLPWHVGVYGTSDYYALDTSLGTFDDLKRLTDEAHQRGLHVLFDLLVNLVVPTSNYIKTNPDWFYRDAQGNVSPHPIWGNCCIDPASSGFRTFLTEYAVECCRQWGADGFRVDAVSYRGGNWNGRINLQPHEHAHAIFTLLDEIRTAIRSVNQDAILMAECFGPQQVPAHDLVSMFQISWITWGLLNMRWNKFTGQFIQHLIGEQMLAMPTDSWLLGYTHTHDSVGFEGVDIHGWPVSAFFQMLSLICPGISIFGGGWNMRDRPGSTREEDEYRKLFTARNMLGGAANNELAFPISDNENLMIVERESNIGHAKIVVNFNKKTQPAPDPEEPWYSWRNSPTGQLKPSDVTVYLK